VLRLLVTKVDELFNVIGSKKRVPIAVAVEILGIPYSNVTKIARYLEQLGLISINYKNVAGPELRFIKNPEAEFGELDEVEIIDKLKFFNSDQDIKSANKLIYDLYNYLTRQGDDSGWEIYSKVQKYYTDNFMKKLDKKLKNAIMKIDAYSIKVDKFVIEIEIVKQQLEAVPFYIISLLKMNDITRLVIDKIKDEVINKITFNVVFKTHEEERAIKQEYKSRVLSIMKEVFPDLSEEYLAMFSDYIIITSLGMGEIEFILKDTHLEEVVINNAHEPVWVYHKKYGWLETNIIFDEESKIVHFATLAARVTDKTITTLTPLMDSHLSTGDRVNATLQPISSKGNTMTIRKFAESPWSITDFIMNKTIDCHTAAMIWTAMQYELSILIVGGTGSGKTSTLNVFSIFIPPSQRVISIEDTRELRLPNTLHWVPLETRLPNPEGKGEVTMLDLIVNSLRMRPDRIIVGEIRRKKEAEVLFEAMHTGHSVYATLHANTVHEAIVRLTTDPIGISKSLLSAVDLMFVQSRNRRTGTRRTFQVAEILEDGNFNLLFNYDFSKDKLMKVKNPQKLYERLKQFAGLSKSQVDAEINDKVKILEHFIKNKITNTEEIAILVNYYYINKKYLMNKLFGHKK
jgi:archaeal flagellar protein FlaI